MLAVALLIEKHFRREISACRQSDKIPRNDSLSCPAEGVGELIVGKIRFGQSEIAQRNVACRIEQNVLGLQIPEN